MFDLFKTIRRKKEEKPEASQADTIPVQVSDSSARKPAPLEPAQFLIGVGQSVGKQRDHNEDTLFTFSGMMCGDKSSLPFGIFIIADGMGGQENGELASSLAARTVADHLIRNVAQPLFGVPTTSQPDPLQEVMHQAVHQAQEIVLSLAPGGGTTLTTALVMGDQITLAHVGDSRAYFIGADKNLELLTRDHSLVQRLIELGQLTKEEAATYPQRNILYRALGQNEPLEADVQTRVFPRPCHLVLCSDGLWGVVAEQVILHTILDSPSPVQACQSLIRAANEAGGPDNISVLVVYYPD